MRISDWSSDVCSSDLKTARFIGQRGGRTGRSAARDRIELDPRQRFIGQIAFVRQGGQHGSDPEAGGAEHGLDLGRAQRAEAGEEPIELLLSADKIGYISIILCNINILHRMICE